MNDKECPTEPAAGDAGKAPTGGFAKVAERLNELYPTRPRLISRQLVHKWWFHRHFNRFPDSIDSTGSGNGGKGRPVFDIEAVVAWYADYLRTRHRVTSQELPAAAIPSSAAPDDDTMAA